MPGRGPQTFKKRQKEQERKDRQQEKMAKRLARKAAGGLSESEDEATLEPTSPDAETETPESSSDVR